jgi:hypothetical protein
LNGDKIDEGLKNAAWLLFADGLFGPLAEMVLSRAEYGGESGILEGRLLQFSRVQ